MHILWQQIKNTNTHKKQQHLLSFDFQKAENHTRVLEEQHNDLKAIKVIFTHADRLEETIQQQ